MPRDLQAAQTRLDRYEVKTTILMVTLAIVYIVLYAIEVLSSSLPESVSSTLNIAGNVIWVTFVIDLAYRIYLAPQRLRYIVSHPIDVIAVALPAFRSLRILRVFTAGQWLMTDGKRVTYGRTGLSLVVGVLVIVGLGGLAILDAEKNVPGATITSFGDGIWFAFTTISTVGYGDLYPATAQGRFVAVGLMILGISLLGIVSGTLASKFLSQIREENDEDISVVLQELRELRVEVAELRSETREDPTRAI